MSSLNRKEKIPALQESGGNIILPAATLHIGGRQYTTTSSIQVALPSLTSYQRYQVFAIVNAGNVELTISTNENSQGPNGADAWRLVGSFYADGKTSATFGAFVNVSGTPSTKMMPYDPSSDAFRFRGFGTPTNIDFNFSYTSRGTIKFMGEFQTGTTVGDNARIPTPSDFTISGSLLNSQIGTYVKGSVSSNKGGLLKASINEDYIQFMYPQFGPDSVDSSVAINGNSVTGSGTFLLLEWEVEMNEIDLTPIEDR